MPDKVIRTTNHGYMPGCGLWPLNSKSIRHILRQRSTTDKRSSGIQTPGQTGLPWPEQQIKGPQAHTCHQGPAALSETGAS